MSVIRSDEPAAGTQEPSPRSSQAEGTESKDTGSPDDGSKTGPQPEETKLLELAQKVDQALGEAHQQEVGAARKAMALRDAVEAFHREGLVRILRSLREDPAGGAILARWSQDPFLQAMFGLHGLIRPDLDQRIQQGLEAARPLLEQHGGDVEYVRREDDVIFVRLVGSCEDCTLAPLTLKEAVTDAVLKRAPEITKIQLVTPEPTPKPVIEHPGEGWERGPDLADLPDEVVLRFDLSKDSVLIRRKGDRLRAWRNRCSHQRYALDGGLHDSCGAQLTCPWHGWSFDLDSGECTNNKTGAPLEPVPLIERGGALWLRP